MHGEFLTFKGEKVSKSKGGLFTISELEEKGFEPMSYRYFCLTTNYRSQMNFSLENLEAAKNSYERLKNILTDLKDDGEVSDDYLIEFEKAIDDDLNIPKALQVLWRLIRDENAVGKYETIKKMDEVFGLDLLKKKEIKISSDVQKLVDEREKYRREKNWKKADELREKIKRKGFLVDDIGEGGRVKKIQNNLIQI